MPNLPTLKQLRFPAYMSIRKGTKIGDERIHLSQEFSDMWIGEGQRKQYVAYFGFENHFPLPLLYPFAQRAHLSLMLDKRFTIGVPGMVHLDNTIVQSEPINTSLPFDLHASVEVLPKKEGSLFPHLLIDYYQGGKKVAYCESKYLARRKSNKTRKRTEKELLSINDIEVDEIWSLSSDVAKRYADISGDYNPIHLSHVFARMAGFKGRIMHGWYNASRAASQAEKLMNKHAKSLNISFLKPVYLSSENRFILGGKDNEKRFALEREGTRMLEGKVGF